MNPNTCGTCAAKLVPRKIWAALPADRRAELREKGQRKQHRVGLCTGCYCASRPPQPKRVRVPVIPSARLPQIVPVDPEEFEWDADTDEVYGVLDGRWMPKPGNPLVRVWVEAA